MTSNNKCGRRALRSRAMVNPDPFQLVDSFQVPCRAFIPLSGIPPAGILEARMVSAVPGSTLTRIFNQSAGSAIVPCRAGIQRNSLRGSLVICIRARNRRRSPVVAEDTTGPFRKQRGRPLNPPLCSVTVHLEVVYLIEALSRTWNTILQNAGGE